MYQYTIHVWKWGCATKRQIDSNSQNLKHICRIYCLRIFTLTHWGWVTHICVSRLTITGSDNGLSPGRRQAIIWTNAGIVLIGPLGTNFSENLIEILTFSLMKKRLKVSSVTWRLFCLGLNVLKNVQSANGMGRNVLWKRMIFCITYCKWLDYLPMTRNHINFEMDWMSY